MNFFQIFGIVLGVLGIGIWIYIGILGCKIMVLQDMIGAKLSQNSRRKT